MYVGLASAYLVISTTAPSPQPTCRTQGWLRLHLGVDDVAITYEPRWLSIALLNLLILFAHLALCHILGPKSGTGC